MPKLLSFSLLILIYIHFTICKVFAKDPESIARNSNNQKNVTILAEVNEDDRVHQPLTFSETGLKNFFQYRFNNRKYSKEILPHNLSDLTGFFEQGKKSNQNRNFIKTVLKIFLQKIKTLEYVTHNEFIKLINQLNSSIGHHFVINNENSPEKKVYTVLYSEFLNHYEIFKSTPESFLNTISEKICKTILKNEKDYDKMDDISISELRSIIIRFIECGLGKILWSISPKDNIWQQFKETCNTLYNLKETQIIYNVEDINDLISSALARFEFLLDVIGSEIKVEVYEAAIHEVKNVKIEWLEIEEYDALMTPKKDLLLETLINSRAKAIASQQFGIISS